MITIAQTGRKGQHAAWLQLNDMVERAIDEQPNWGAIELVLNEWQPLLDSPVVWDLVDANGEILSKGAGEPTGEYLDD